MLQKKVAEVALQFLRDGMGLDDAVRAAHNIEGVKVAPEVDKVLTRAIHSMAKLPEYKAGSPTSRASALPFAHEMVVQLQKGISNSLDEGYAARPRKLERRAVLENFWGPRFTGAAARDYALKQLGLMG